MNELIPPTYPALEPSPASAPPPTRRSPLWIFFGADGLRAGWSLIVFVVLFAAISFAAQFAVAKIRHKPFGPAAQKAAQQKAATEKAATGSPDSSVPKEEKPRSMILSEGSAFLAVLLATFLTAKIERRPTRVFGFGGVHRLPQLLQGLAWGVLCLSALVAVLHVAGFLRFDSRLLANAAAAHYALIWALGFILVACLEESLLRGYVQYTLARGLAGIYGTILKTPHRHAYGFWTAAFILSFVFGLGHGSNPGESPIGLLAAGCAGLVFCLALYRTGSLWWAIGFHASWDWAQSFLYGVADSGTMVQGHLFAAHPIGKPILSGGLTGPEGSIFVLPTLALVAAIILFTLPRTHHPGEGLSHPDN